MVNRFEGPLHCSLHRFVDALKAFAEISRDGRDVPSKTEGDFFDGSTSAELKAKSGYDASRVCDESLDMNSAVMVGVRVGETTRHAHDISHVFVHEWRIGRKMRPTKLADRFVSWNIKMTSTTNNIDSGKDRVEGSARNPTVFAYSKVVFAFVKAKANLYRVDVVECRVEKAVARIQ